MRIALGKNKSEFGENKDIYIPISFELKENLVIENSLSNTINSYKQFEKERNGCAKYNLNITINPYLTNILCNTTSIIKEKSTGSEVTDEDTRIDAIQNIQPSTYDYSIGYDIFDNNFERVDTFKTGSTISGFTGSTLFDLLTISEAIEKNIVYDEGWLCVENKCKIGNIKMFPDKMPYEKIDLFPTREYFSFKPNIINGVEINNWNVIITYPYSSDDTHELINDIATGYNGIPIYKSYTVNIYGRNYIFIQTPYKHGFKNGDIVKIHSLNKTYLVNNVGNENDDYTEHMFSIDTDKYKDITVSGITNSRVSRVINGAESVYYLRKLKKLPYVTHEKYDLAFSQTIYGEKVIQIQNTEDLDISELKDNIGRPVSELYMTIIKNSKDCNTVYDFHNAFSSVSSGIDSLVDVTGYTNIRKVNGDVDGETGIERSITGTTQDIFYGDIAEYNSQIAKEIILDEVYHRFNTTKREMNSTFIHHEIGENNNYVRVYNELEPYLEGYIYKPHHKIKIKNYSKVLSTDKMYELKINTAPISGITTNGLIKLLTNITDSDVSYILMESNDFSIVDGVNKMRITKKINNKYENFHAYVHNVETKLVAIEYDPEFMGTLSGFTYNSYTFKTYGSSLIPYYAQDRYDGTCAWREMLSEGVFDSDSDLKTENVFSNGRFYLNSTVNLYLKRQDPSGVYGLRKNQFPNDYGSINVEKPIEDNKIKTTNNIC